MNIVLDACSLINLINGQVLQSITLIQSFTIHIGSNLLNQEILNPAQKIYIEALIASNTIQLLESNVSFSEFQRLKEKYKLGDGETDCIALCKENGFIIASDDLRARKCALKELTTKSVVGSLYLLKEGVNHNIFDCNDAYKSYLTMKAKGAFLPEVENNYFC